MPDSLLVPTPLGDLRFRAQFERAQPAVRLSLTSIPITPTLPPGMTVNGCVGVVLECKAAAALYGLRFECAWTGASPSSMSAASGEWLDAQEWSNDEHVVMIGTEDSEGLCHRLGPTGVLGEVPDRYLIGYEDTGLVITVDEVPAATALSLHFVVAWNRLPELKEDSCWFAVDIAHQTLLSSVQLGRSAT